MKISRFRTNTLKSAPDRIDRENRIIYGVSVNTEGPALGHGLELDRDFVDDVTKLGNSAPKGSKSRFGHPGVSAEALGTYIGRFKNFRTIEREGKLRAIANLHIDDSTKTAPGGDRGEYVMNLAETSPDMFATSIVFKGWEFKKDKDGNKKVKPKYWEYDSENVFYKDLEDYDKIDSPRYATIESLSAVDFVDEPAANPDGLFSEDTFAGIAGKFLNEHPAVKKMLADNPDILEELAKDERFDSFFEGYPQIKDLISNKPEAAKSFLDKYNKLPSVTTDNEGEEVPLNLVEFKEKHPEIYREAFAEGVTSERDRVNAHLTFGKKSGALDIAFKAIEDGEGLTQTLTAKYLSAGMDKRDVENRADDNPVELGVPEVTPENDPEEAHKKAALAAAKELKVKIKFPGEE